MKKLLLITFFLATFFNFNSFGYAVSLDPPSDPSLGEFRPRLFFTQEFTYGNSGRNNKNENFVPATRLRFGFEYHKDNEIFAYVHFNRRPYTWGDNGKDLSQDPNANLLIRYAVFEWAMPETNFRVQMGRLPIVTPYYAFGSSILDGRSDAINIYGEINENISINTAWLRLASDDEPSFDNNGNYIYKDDDADAFLLSTKFDYDIVKIAPWFMYIKKGADVGIKGKPLFSDFAKNYPASTNSYVFATSLEYSQFSPLIFALDTVYSQTSYDKKELMHIQPDASDNVESYLIASRIKYTTDNGVASLGAWYTPGDNYNEVLQKNIYNKHAVVLDADFVATSMLFDDNIFGFDRYNGLRDSVFGTWGLVVEHKNFSFLPKLKHTARLAYVEGTHESPNWANNSRPLDKKSTFSPKFNYLVQGDKLVELNFNSYYMLQKNILIALELGHMWVNFKDTPDFSGYNDGISRSSIVVLYWF